MVMAPSTSKKKKRKRRMNEWELQIGLREDFRHFLALSTRAGRMFRGGDREGQWRVEKKAKRDGKVSLNEKLVEKVQKVFPTTFEFGPKVRTILPSSTSRLGAVHLPSPLRISTRCFVNRHGVVGGEVNRIFVKFFLRPLFFNTRGKL